MCFLGDMQGYSSYKGVFWACGRILGIHAYSGYTGVFWVYMRILGIHAYSGNTDVFWVYSHILGIQAHSGDTGVFWAYRRILSIRAYVIMKVYLEYEGIYLVKKHICRGILFDEITLPIPAFEFRLALQPKIWTYFPIPATFKLASFNYSQ